MGGGKEVQYEEKMSPEQKAFRKAMYDFLNPPGQDAKWTEQIPQYPGPLPFQQQPDQGQMAGMGAIMQLLGYPGYQWSGLPGVPPVETTGGGGGGPPGGGGGGGGGNGPGNYRPDRPWRR